MNRKLGTNGPLVSAIGLGCMSLSGAYGIADEQQSIATIHRALELGNNFFDTADYYRTGHNEELIGKAINGNRDKAFLSVKTGQLMAPAANKGFTFGPVNAHPTYLKNAILYSLQRLKTDYIDLYTPGRVDPTVPIEDTVGALADMVDKGFIRYIGLSEASAATLRKAAAVAPITALQIEYSLWSRDVEAEVLPTARELGIGIVAYSPLSRGFLSGEVKSPEDLKDNRVNMPRFQGENFYKNLELVKKIESLAAQKGCTPAQLALAWILAQSDNIIAIPGTKHIKRLEENIAAGDLQLTKEELQSIEDIMPAGIVSGTRYPSFLMDALGR